MGRIGKRPAVSDLQVSFRQHRLQGVRNPSHLDVGTPSIRLQHFGHLRDVLFISDMEEGPNRGLRMIEILDHGSKVRAINERVVVRHSVMEFGVARSPTDWAALGCPQWRRHSPNPSRGVALPVTEQFRS